MKERFVSLSFVILTSLLLTTSLVNGQTNTVATADYLVSPEAKIKANNNPNPKNFKPYWMRLDFMTESIKDEIIQSGSVGLDDICDYTMGCQNRKDIILNKGDKIQLFTDSRIKEVELIYKNSGKKAVIATSVTNSKESYILVTQQITRENIDSYMLLILK